MKNKILSNREKARRESVLPGGLPRWVRCYDNEGKSADRYTVVFTNLKKKDCRGTYPALALSSQCFHPAYGVASWVFGKNSAIDRPAYSHLGKKIEFTELPEDPKRFALNCYKELWGII